MTFDLPVVNLDSTTPGPCAKEPLLLNLPIFELPEANSLYSLLLSKYIELSTYEI